MPAKRIGLIGCGKWGRFILRDLVTLGCEVHVAEHRENNRHHAMETGAKSTSTDFDQLPESLDAYVIATQTDTHFNVLSKIIPKNKPVFCEKPICPSLVQAKQIASEGGDRIFVMHKWRYHPAVEKMREIVVSGELGKVIGISTRRQQWSLTHTDSDAVWHLAPHDLSIIFHILGYLPQPLWASAHRNPAGGFSKLVGFLGPQPMCQIQVSECWASNDRGIQVYLENGALLMADPLSTQLILRRGKPSDKNPEESIAIAGSMPLFEELRHFVAYLNGGPVPMTGMADEVKIIEAIETLMSMSVH